MNQTSLLRGLGAAGIAILCASCASNLEMTKVPMAANSSSEVSKPARTNDLHSSINSYRQSIGKAPLRRHAGLDRLAQQHCEFMANNRGKFNLGSSKISHYGFEERALKAQHSFSMQNVAENVAGGVIHGDISAALVKSWTQSNEHAYNIKQNWDATGIGIYRAPDGMVYATQLFATEQQQTHMSMMDRLSGF